MRAGGFLRKFGVEHPVDDEGTVRVGRVVWADDQAAQKIGAIFVRSYDDCVWGGGWSVTRIYIRLYAEGLPGRLACSARYSRFNREKNAFERGSTALS